MRAKAFIVVALSAIGLAAGLAACSNGADQPTVVVAPTEPLSTLTLRWSLDGSTDPSSCTQSIATRIDISIIDPVTGGEIQAFQQDCQLFETSITLAPGTYGARARLIDDAGNARTTDVSVPTFSLIGNDELVQDVDFPAASFL